MRAFKALGLAAIAALAAMAFVGASTASADSLCTTNPGHANECPAGNIYKGNILGTASSAVLLNQSKEQIEKCGSVFLGNGSSLVNEGSHKGLSILLQPLLFANCEGICETAAGKVGSNLLIEALALDAWITADGALAPGAELEDCVLGVKCHYEFESAKQLLSASGNALTAIQVPVKRSSGSALCPAKGFWDAAYSITTDGAGHPPIFITSLP